MTTAAIDYFLLQHAPAAPKPLPFELADARAALNAALADISLVRDAALEKPWFWQGHELDIRYGIYAQYEALEDARALVTRMLAAGATQAAARPLVAATTQARWEVHGILAGLDDGDLDRDPGNDEWTLRRTLAHIVSGQRAYAWGVAWWLARRDAPADDYPMRVPQDVIDLLPAEETEANGSIDDVRRRFDDVTDLSCGIFSGLDESALAARSRYAGMPVDVRFRIRRWPSHIREHTIQLEKTLGFIGRPISEVERLLRLIAGAYGRLEEQVFVLDVPAEALASVARTAREIADRASTVRAAAAGGE